MLSQYVQVRLGFSSRFFVAYFDFAIERLVGVLRIFSFTIFT